MAITYVCLSELNPNRIAQLIIIPRNCALYANESLNNFSFNNVKKRITKRTPNEINPINGSIDLKNKPIGR